MPRLSAIYRFRLSARFSFGRKELLALWRRASEQRDANVSRVESGPGYGEAGYTYLLWAPKATGADAEKRMTELLGVALPLATIRLIRLSGTESVASSRAPR
jgi:hypothetical protein